MAAMTRRGFLTGFASALGLGISACASDNAQEASSEQATEEATEQVAAEAEVASEEAGSAEVAFEPLADPIITEVAYRTYQISEFGMDSLFWIEGDERAVLLDTGTGTFDIPAFISAHFADKPYDVVLTHGHVDHASGMYQFEKVYLNELDHDLALEHTKIESRKNYVEHMLGMSGGIYGITPDSCIEGDLPEFLPLNEGDTFDLGGRVLEVYFTPGHTAGGCSLLDRETRIMFTGDACNQNTLLTPFVGGEQDATDGQTISGLMHTAEKLQELGSEFDRNLNGHMGYARWLTFTSQSPLVIPECIDLCQKILDGTVVGEDTYNMDGLPCLIAKSETGAIQVTYFDWQIR